MLYLKLKNLQRIITPDDWSVFQESAIQRKIFPENTKKLRTTLTKIVIYHIILILKKKEKKKKKNKKHTSKNEFQKYILENFRETSENKKKRANQKREPSK